MVDGDRAGTDPADITDTYGILMEPRLSFTAGPLSGTDARPLLHAVPLGKTVSSGTYVNSGTYTDTNLNDTAFALTGGVLDNTGTIDAAGVYDIGVYIDGGTLLNTGLIESSGNGTLAIKMAASQSFTNQGRVLSNGTAAINGSTNETIDNSGTGSSIQGYRYGINILSGTVTNAGTIEGASAYRGFGVYEVDGGTVSNASTGTIAGASGIGFAAGPGVVENYGTVLGTSSTGGGAGITFLEGGTLVNNGTTALIRGNTGVRFAGTYAATVDNSGTIEGQIGLGIYADNVLGFSLDNSGLIEGESGVRFATGTLDNSGTIKGTTAAGGYFGVETTGGTVINRHGGYIGGYVGVVFGAAVAHTLVDYGTIEGGSGIAISFGRLNDLLKLGGSYDIIGNVGGGGGVNTLELSAYDGAGALSGIGTKFTQFQVIEVDAGANWTFTGNNTLAAGYTATVDGALTNSGYLLNNGTLIDSGYLDNTGTLVNNVGGVAVTVAAGGTLENSCTIEATTGTAVSGGTNVTIDNAANARIIGYRYGVDVLSGTVVNAGTIEGSSAFTGFGVYEADGGTVTNTTSGTIEGATGIGFAAGPGTVDNYGSVLGTSSAGGGAGITFLHGGTLTNNGTTALVRGNAGVIFGGTYAASVDNSGRIYGTIGAGIYAKAVTDFSLVNGTAGIVSGYSFGAYFADGSVNNAGTIEATGTNATRGIYATGTNVQITNLAGGLITGYVGVFGVTTLYNAGTIDGTTNAVIFGTGPNLLEIEAGAKFGGNVQGDSASAGNNTIDLIGGSAGTPGSFTGFGSQFLFFYTLDVVSGANWQIYGANTLATSSYTLIDAGVLTNTGVLTTHGTIDVSGTLTNAAGGQIIDPAAGGIGVDVSGATALLVNHGLVEATGSGGIGVELTAGLIENYGTIEGSGTLVDAVYVTGAASVVNENGGTIEMSGDGAAGNEAAAVALDGGGSVTNVAGGTIVATYGVYGAGIANNGAAAIYVLNAGTVAGSEFGVFGSATIVNSGLIEETGTGGIGIDMPTGTITNTGTIDALTAGGTAIRLIGAGTINNSALIDGANYGVELDGGGRLVNTGTIEAPTGTALVVTGAAYLKNAAGATITGNAGIRFGALGNNYTLYNAGTIDGTGGTGLQFGSGNDLLEIVGGAYFSGKVDGGTGTNTLELIGGGANAVLSGFGTQFTSFQELYVSRGADWSLTNTNTIAPGETLLDAGTLTVNGTIVDQSTIDVTSTGTLLFGNGNDVLDLAAGAVLSIASGGAVDGGGGTNTLELSAGVGTGTLNGFGSSFINFQDIVVANGGTWLMGGSNTILSNEALIDYGDLTVGGTFDDKGGVIVGSGATLAVSGTFVDEGNLTVDAGGLLTLSSTAAVFALAAGVTPAGTIDGGGGTLELLAGTSTLNGFGTNLANFSSLYVATGGDWALGGGITLGGSLLNHGELTSTVTGADAITLTAGAYVLNTGTIDSTGGTAVAIGATGAVDIVNRGTIEETGAGVAGSYAGGIRLLAGGNVTNAAGGTIIASGAVSRAVQLDNAGTVVNRGYIEATSIGVFLATTGSLDNIGTIKATGNDSFGAALQGGTLTNSGTIIDTGDTADAVGVTTGSMTNAATGLIEQSGTNAAAVFVNGTGNFLNYGTVLANGTYDQSGIAVTSGRAVNANTGQVTTTGSGSVSVYVDGNGTFINHGKVVATGSFSTGVRVTGTGSATNTAAGSIVATGADSAGVVLRGAGTFVNAGYVAGVSYGVIGTVGSTITNSGTIEGTGSGAFGVDLVGGATLTNSGSIGASFGAAVYGRTAAASVTNQSGGRIVATGALSQGIDLAAGGAVTNAGYIAGVGVGVFFRAGGSLYNSGQGNIQATGGNGVGVYLYAGGTVTNAGTIEGVAAGVYLRGGTLNNSGTIEATGGAGIGAILGGTGELVNSAGGTISGDIGVELFGAGATLINGGLIESSAGASGVAVVLGSGDLLVWEAGGRIVGTIEGGGGTLELTTGSAATGTLTDLGTYVTDFSLIEVDSSASWNITGTGSLSAGETLTDAGTLTVSGSLTDSGLISVTGALIDTGVIDISYGTLTDATNLTGAGTVVLSDFGILDLGSGASGGTIEFTDGTGTLEIGDVAAFSDQITGFMHGDVIDLTGIQFSSADTVTYSNGHALIYDGTQLIADLAISGLPYGATLALTSDNY